MGGPLRVPRRPRHDAELRRDEGKSQGLAKLMIEPINLREENCEGDAASHEGDAHLVLKSR